MIVNILSMIGFGICSVIAMYKKVSVETFLGTPHFDLQQSTIMALQACSLAWSAMAACAGLAAGISAINIWINATRR